MCMDYPKSILDEEKEAYKVMRKVKDGYGTIFVSTDINKIYKKNELYISHPIGSTYYSLLTAQKFFHAFEDKATAKVALESFTEILKWNVVIDNKENFVIVKVKLKGSLHSGVVWAYSWGVLAGNEMTIIEEVN